MKVLYSQRHRADQAVESDCQASYVSLDECLALSDFVSLHCPLNQETKGLIGSRELSLMKRDSILINTARGAIIDEKALVAALVERRIRGAGLDVFTSEPHVPEEFLALDNVVLTPHIGSASKETRSLMARVAVEGLLAAMSGRPPSNMVNPQVFESFLKQLE